MLLVICLFFSNTLQAQYPIINLAELRQQIVAAKNDSTRIRLYSMLGWELRFTNHIGSEKIANDIIRLATEKNDYLGLAEGYQIKGFAKVIDKQLAESITLYSTAMDYAKKAKSIHVQAHLLSLMGGMYQDKGDFDKAISYYLEGLQMAERNQDVEMIAALSKNLAEAYSDAGRSISFILPFYERALKEEIAIKNWQYVGMIYSNIAKDYMQAGNIADATKAAKLSIGYIKQQNNRAYVYATVVSDIGEVYAGLGSYAEAEKYLLQGYAMLDSIGTKDNKLIPLAALAKLYIKKNEPIKAEKTANHLLQLATAYKTKLFLRDANKVLADLAKKRNQPALALQYFEQYKNWDDSLYKDRKEKSIADVESRIKMEQQELELRFGAEKKAQENKALQLSHIALQYKTSIILIAAAILLFTGILLYVGYRIQSRKNKELEIQKRIIERQSAEKDTLIREMNHRVKNNLQIVSSLLNLQANSLTDSLAIEALRESHKRVSAISLIHQKLYGQEERASIPLEEYINSLFADLKTVYAANQVAFDCIVDPANIQLDIEKAVPVGLILNETITNALKYAFINRDTGKIAIRFTEHADNSYTLEIQDDGVGLPEGFDPIKNTSLGFRIIKELTRQLRGSYQYTTLGGTRCRIHFPKIGN